MTLGIGTRILIGIVVGAVIGAILGDRVVSLEPVGSPFIRVLMGAAIPPVRPSSAAGPAER